MATRGPNALFLLCALQPLVFNQSFPNLHQIFIWPCSRPQYILVTNSWHLWPLEGQIHFLLSSLQGRVFNPSSSNLHQIFIWPKSRLQSIFFLPSSDICGHQRVNFIFYCVHTTEQSFQLIFSKFTPNVLWAKVWTPIYCPLRLVTFVATRGPTSFFCVHSSFHLKCLLLLCPWKRLNWSGWCMLKSS